MTQRAPTTIAAACRRIRPSGGFTLVELLIAIGVLALVSIGLAVIFGSIGETVSEGRRISTLNRSAERIEQQIRADLERLTRDGYLVIAHRYASEEATGSSEPETLEVALSPRDSRPRERRADEIMFFARGDFVSRRTPLASGVVASANEAAIYYGIGQKRVPDLETRLNDASNFFFNPFPTDTNLESTRRLSYAPLLGVVATGGAPANPNRYAQDWALVRQVSLLTTPEI
ncbi:MAG: prepilin-type N-terminal cleavage/methylation domain-containing protein, partial [Planctomycetota bacterium]